MHVLLKKLTSLACYNGQDRDTLLEKAKVNCDGEFLNTESRQRNSSITRNVCLAKVMQNHLPYLPHEHRTALRSSEHIHFNKTIIKFCIVVLTNLSTSIHFESLNFNQFINIKY